MNMSYLNMEFSKLIPYSTDMCVEPAPVLGSYSGVLPWYHGMFNISAMNPLFQ